MSHAGRRGATFFLSLVFHAGLAFALVLLPILAADVLPEQEVKAFLPPLAMAPPLPPPAPLGSSQSRARSAPKPVQVAFVDPIVTADLLPGGESLLEGRDLAGDRDGTIDGGPGGVVGSVMDELPPSTPPSLPRVVRIGNGIKAPRLVRRVEPAYPALALAARLSATVVVEAEVDVRGEVASVRVERGHPLFDDAALAAVRQWRYQPLLLNGEPTAFVLSVTVTFALTR